MYMYGDLGEIPCENIANLSAKFDSCIDSPTITTPMRTFEVSGTSACHKAYCKESFNQASHPFLLLPVRRNICDTISRRAPAEYAVYHCPRDHALAAVGNPQHPHS